MQLSERVRHRMKCEMNETERKKNTILIIKKWGNYEFTLKWFSISSCNVSLKYKFVILDLN